VYVFSLTALAPVPMTSMSNRSVIFMRCVALVSVAMCVQLPVLVSCRHSQAKSVNIQRPSVFVGEVREALVGDSELRMSLRGGVPSEPVYTGELVQLRVSRAWVDEDENGYPAVAVQVVTEDADKLRKWTAKRLGLAMAIVVDDKVVTVATIVAPVDQILRIDGGIEGFERNRANELAARLTPSSRR
jgi:hypothetical protein